MSRLSTSPTSPTSLGAAEPDGAAGPPGADVSADYARVEAAIRYLEAHATAQPSLAQVAAVVGLSPHHFHRLFRRWAGITPKRFVQAVTLEHARRHIDASRSVLDASLRAGLSGPGRLHDLFVTHRGVTPGEHSAAGLGVEITWGRGPSPFGDALIARTPRGVCHLSFTPAAPQALRAAWPRADLRRDDQAARAWLEAVFSDAPTPLHVRGTNHQVQVWEALLTIPRGALTTYGDLAARLGRPRAARAVAGAVARNEVAWLIPCHRVLGRLGQLGGYRWGTTRKRAMLAWERGGDADAPP